MDGYGTPMSLIRPFALAYVCERLCGCVCVFVNNARTLIYLQ